MAKLSEGSEGKKSTPHTDLEEDEENILDNGTAHPGLGIATSLQTTVPSTPVKTDVEDSGYTPQ
jgi:hypothetical protein